MFLQVSVILSTGACMVALGGHTWLLWGACVVALGGCMVAPGGMHGCSGGACVVAPGGGGHAWLLPEGVCMLTLGGCAWFFWWDTVNERAVRILLECILVNIAVTDFDAMISARYSGVFVVTELCWANFHSPTHTEPCRLLVTVVLVMQSVTGQCSSTTTTPWSPLH